MLVALAACGAGTPALEMGQSAELESDTLDVSITVTDVSESDAETLGLTGLGGGELDGVPWVVDFQINYDSDPSQDFDWDEIPSLSYDQWAAELSPNGTETAVNTGYTVGSDWCPGYEEETPEDVVGTFCQVFLLSEGSEIASVTLTDVAQWNVAGE